MGPLSVGPRAARFVARTLLKLYPRGFRRDVGSEVIRDFELAAADHLQTGARSFLIWLARNASSLVSNAGPEWKESLTSAGAPAAGRNARIGAMDVLRQDLGYAVRSLRKRPGFTALVVFTLGLGIGATTAMFSVVRGILLRPLPYPESERLVTVWESTPEDVTSPDGGLLSHANFRDVQAETPSIESIALANGFGLTVTEDGGAELVRGARITPGLFEVFRTPLVKGRDFTDLENRHRGPAVAIVGADYWRDRFGPLDEALGSSIRIGGQAHQIVGVAPSGFDYPGDARVWIPAQNDEAGCGRGCVNRGSVARLAPDATVETARAELETLATRLEAEYPSSNANTTFSVASLHAVTVGDVRPALWLLLGAVGMVLLIACANVANLILVRGRSRLTEVAVRTTLGAGQRRIFKQLLTESALIALLGGLAGLGLAVLAADLVLSLAPANIPRLDEVGLDPTTLGFAGLLVLVTTLLFGATPALLLSRVELTQALRSGGRGNVTRGRSARSRTAILTTEVALSVLLLVGAGLMIRSLARTTEIEPGFDARDIAIFRLSLPRTRYSPDERVRFMDRLSERLGAVPGVDDVAVMVGPPLSSVSIFGGFTRTDLPAPDPGEGPIANYRALGPGAIEMLAIPILQGRAFQRSDTYESEQVVIITQQAAERYFVGDDPVGRQIHVQVSTGYDEAGPRTIVGVAGDIRGTRLTQAPAAETFIPYAQAGAGFPHVLMRGDDSAALLEAARRELRSLDPELPLMRPGTLAELVDLQLAQPRFYLLLLAIFASLAVVLAGVGMYGVVAYAVSQRTREIGVRMALGARVPQVVQLVLWQGIRPAMWGIGLGVVAAFWAGGLMRGLLYEVAPQDPLTLVMVPPLLLGIVVVACAIPARRAARIPPATALRNE